MSDAHGVSRDQLRAFIERIERLEEEKKTLADDIKDVYGEAKSMGFDTKIIRKVISIRKIDADVRAEQEAILDTYLGALGMIAQPDFFDDEPRQAAPVDREARTKRRTSEAMDDNKAFSAELVSAGLISEEAHAENVALSDAVARKLGAGVIDPETGEFLDDEQPETAKEPRRPAKAAASGGEPSIPSSDDGGAKMDGRSNDDPGRADEQSADIYTQSEQATNSEPPAFIAKSYTRRPHCLDRAGCASYTEEHCTRCKSALMEREFA